MRYRTFFLRLPGFGLFATDYRVTINFFKKGNNVYFFINLTVKRSNPWQIPPNHGKMRRRRFQVLIAYYRMTYPCW